VLGARRPLELDRRPRNAAEVPSQLGNGTIHGYIVGA
jgi:hypothetical protein